VNVNIGCDNAIV